METNYDSCTLMHGEFPVVRKLGAISPNGESSPFVWNAPDGERLMWLELVDKSHGTINQYGQTLAIIRDFESGEILSRFGEGCYYYSFYQENDTAYVLGVLSGGETNGGDEIVIFESRDLISWSRRTLFRRPGWRYYNTSLTKGSDGYVLLMEADRPVEAVGAHPFTLFFATSKNLRDWTFMPDELGFSKERYMGGPYMRYSRGWYYVIAVTELPCQRYTNYIYRTRDFRDWYVGLYNPILMPGNGDRLISPMAHDIDDETRRSIQNGFISNNSDIDMCEYRGKTVIGYIVGNQLGFYYMAMAVYDGGIDDFLAAYFD